MSSEDKMKKHHFTSCDVSAMIGECEFLDVQAKQGEVFWEVLGTRQLQTVVVRVLEELMQQEGHSCDQDWGLHESVALVKATSRQHAFTCLSSAWSDCSLEYNFLKTLYTF